MNNADATTRQSIITLLSESELSAKELSKILGIREKEVLEHLSHIEKSVAAKRRKLVIVPAQCLTCGHSFADRRRFTKPGRCPRCKKERVSEPRFNIR